MAVMWVVVAAGSIAFGMLVIYSALRPHSQVSFDDAAPKDRARRSPFVVAALVGIIVLATTRWMLPALATGAIGWLISAMVLDQRRQRADDLERIEALATWTEQLRDVLMAGDQPMGAIQATVATCPEPVRPQVRALAARLGRQPEAFVLRQFADDLDDPTADLVATGLLVALTRGARAERVLSSLAAQARHQAERRKILEAEREPARREVLWVTGLMCLQLVGGLTLARSTYLAPYRSFTGQLVLSVLLLVFLALIVYVRRLSRFPRPARILSLRATS